LLRRSPAANNLLLNRKTSKTRSVKVLPADVCAIAQGPTHRFGMESRVNRYGEAIAEDGY
jgi:hypothetical protein